jgi:hypothetical protein
MELNELEHFKAGKSQLWVRIVYKTSLSQYVMQVASPWARDGRVISSPLLRFDELKDRYIIDTSGKGLTTSFVSVATLQQIQLWQTKCKGAHNSCRLSSEPDSSDHFLPTRLTPGCSKSNTFDIQRYHSQRKVSVE